ncbi:VWA domain-containing protein [Streptomyces lateritius]|uniref:VWA domain-containing protein n=1 Tax=Streptomyces lateritius TaxID=67313 RepID=UPI0021AB4B65|nr:VWA domain-containing protein [Streptomyces lateritius]
MGIRSMLRKVFGRDREETPATSVPPQTRETPTPDTPDAPGAPDDAARRAADDLVAASFDNPQIPRARAKTPSAGTTGTVAATGTADAGTDASAGTAEESAEPVAAEEPAATAEEPEAAKESAATAEEPEESVATADEPEAVQAEAADEAAASDAEPSEDETDAPAAETAAEQAEAEAEADEPTEPEAGTADEPQAEVTEAEAGAEAPQAEADEPAEPEADAADEPQAEVTEAAEPQAEAAEPEAEAGAEAPEAEADEPAEPEAGAEAPEAEADEPAEPEADATDEPQAEAAEPEAGAKAPEAEADEPAEPEADATDEPQAEAAEPEADAATEPQVDALVADGPALALAKVKAAAPHLADAYKAAGAQLKKQGLTGARAAVYLVVDRSGSMRGYFKDGSVQRLAEQVTALAAHLDEDATVTTVFFSTDIDGTVDLTPADLTPTRVEEINGTLGRLGRTNYHRAVEEVLAHHAKADPARPALVVFQTDGAPESKTAATQALAEAADRPLHWRFVAWGEEDNKAFDFLRKLEGPDGAPRTAVYFPGATPVETPHPAFYRGLLADLEF